MTCSDGGGDGNDGGIDYSDDDDGGDDYSDADESSKDLWWWQ